MKIFAFHAILNQWINKKLLFQTEKFFFLFFFSSNIHISQNWNLILSGLLRMNKALQIERVVFGWPWDKSKLESIFPYVDLSSQKMFFTSNYSFK